MCVAQGVSPGAENTAPYPPPPQSAAGGDGLWWGRKFGAFIIPGLTPLGYTYSAPLGLRTAKTLSRTHVKLLF